MATVIRPEISSKSKYWIERHRYYELKHFCLQYPTWKRTYKALDNLGVTISTYDRAPNNTNPSDITAKYALRRSYYSSKIDMIERAAMDADEDLYLYIIKGVTEGNSYTYLKSRLNIPCSRDTYYDRYRRFFWLLSEARG